MEGGLVRTAGHRRSSRAGTWFTAVLEEAVPRAEDAARHLVNLPTHARVDEHDVEEIAARVTSAQRQKASATRPKASSHATYR